MTAEEFFKAVYGRKPKDADELRQFTNSFLIWTAQQRALGNDVPGRVPTEDEWKNVVAEGKQERLRAELDRIVAGAGPETPPEPVDRLRLPEDELTDEAVARLEALLGIAEANRLKEFYQAVQERGLLEGAGEEERIWLEKYRKVLNQVYASEIALGIPFKDIAGLNLPATAQELTALMLQQQQMEQTFNDAFRQEMVARGLKLDSDMERRLKAELAFEYERQALLSETPVLAGEFVGANLDAGLEEAITEQQEKEEAELFSATLAALQETDPEKAAHLVESEMGAGGRTEFPVAEVPVASTQARMKEIGARLDEIRGYVGEANRKLGEEGLVLGDEAALRASIVGFEEQQKQLRAELGTVGQEFVGAQAAAGVPTLLPPRGPFLPPEIDARAAFEATVGKVQDKGFAGFLRQRQAELESGFTAARAQVRGNILAGSVAAGEAEEPYTAAEIAAIEAERQAQGFAPGGAPTGRVILSEKTAKLHTAPSFAEYLSGQLPTLLGEFTAGTRAAQEQKQTQVGEAQRLRVEQQQAEAEERERIRRQQREVRSSIVQRERIAPLR